MQKRIPIMVPRVPASKSFLKYLEEIDRNRKYSNFGPLHEKLLDRFSDYLKLPFINLALSSNATLAIWGALSTASLETKSIINMPSWTFTASAAAAKSSGIKVEFSDVGSDWRMKINGDESFILDVLPFGDEIQFNRYDSLTNNSRIVIDAAASFDSMKNIGRALLELKHQVIVIISLHATKLIAAGEGALIFSNNKEWITNFRKWTNFGFENDRISRNLGINAKLDEFRSAVCLASLDEWPVNRNYYIALDDLIKQYSSEINITTTPSRDKGIVTPYWIVKVNHPKWKYRIENELRNQNIEFRNWWGAGCHKMPAYKDINFKSLPNTELLSQTTIGLPYHLDLEESDISRILDCFNL